jgi:molybdate transport system permease protein
MYGVRGSLRAWIDGLLTLPLVLPPTVVGFFLLLLLGRRSLIGHALEQIGIVVVFSWPATVIAATVVAFPLMYRTTLGAFEQVNPNLLDAARTLGASEWRVFRRVLLPMAAPGVLAGTVLAFARAMGEFGATLMLAGNIPGRTQTMPIAIFSAAEGGDMRVAFLWVSLIVVLSLAIIRLLHWERKTRKATPNLGALILASASAPQAQFPRATDAGIRSASLEIHVEKALEAFNLDVGFCAGQGARGKVHDVAHDRRHRRAGSGTHRSQWPRSLRQRDRRENCRRTAKDRSCVSGLRLVSANDCSGKRRLWSRQSESARAADSRSEST